MAIQSDDCFIMRITDFDDLVALAAENPLLFQKKYRSCKEIFLIRGLWGENIFHYLCVEGYANSVKIMLEMGADVNTTNTAGETPLAACSFIEQKEMVEILLAAGADPNLKNNQGQTTLHWAYSNPGDSLKKTANYFLIAGLWRKSRLEGQSGIAPQRILRTEPAGSHLWRPSRLSP